MLTDFLKEPLKRIFIQMPVSFKVDILSRLKPKAISIEPTNACNLRCPFCATTTGLERPTGVISMENFRYIVDMVKPYVKDVWLYFMGEPLLVKDLFPMIRYCLENGMQPHFITNGMLIDKYVDEFIDSGLQGFRVALDGYDKKTHEKYRVRSDFDQIINGIKTLVQRKRELGVKTPQIAIQSLAFGYNDIEKIKAMGEELGVDNIKIKAPRLSDYSEDTNVILDTDGESSLVQDIADFVPKDEKYMRLAGKNKVPFARDMQYCSYMRKPVITWDGNVVPCCFDFKAKEPLGNVFEDDLLSILRSDRGREVLRKYFDKTLSICKSCDALYEEP
jgi:radical SAM protein with 4Fe4S-binding SPASM domain